MASPALSEIMAATQLIVKNARKQNRLPTLTPRMIRQQVEQTLGLDTGTLDTKDYKDAVKDATNAALAVENDSDDDIPIQNESKPSVKGKKRKSDVVEAETVVENVKKPQPKSTKKHNLALVGSAEAKKEGASKDSGSKKVFKSAAIIETSDEDEEAEAVSTSTHGPKGQQPAMKVKSPKRRRKTKVSSDAEPGSSPVSKPKSKAKHPDTDSQSNVGTESGPSTLKLPHESKGEDGGRSESEMSVLVDATPIKRGAKKREKAPAKAKKEAKEKKAKKSTTELSKDEETIKRLKSFVYACGVRKVWTKEFQNIDTASQQIKRLKEILAELGMNGRHSMEKAKAIKEKRDLAKELEDVRSFEQAVIGGPSGNPSHAKSNVRKQETDSPSGNESEDGRRRDFSDEAPTKHRNAARRSIMAFLGDDSDDE